MDKVLDIDFDEIEYTPDEEAEVVQQLDFALLLQELQIRTTKEALKDWFANLQFHKKGEYCPNVTGQDLIEIAKRAGFKIVG